MNSLACIALALWPFEAIMSSFLMLVTDGASAGFGKMIIVALASFLMLPYIARAIVSGFRISWVSVSSWCLLVVLLFGLLYSSSVEFGCHKLSMWLSMGLLPCLLAPMIVRSDSDLRCFIRGIWTLGVVTVLMVVAFILVGVTREMDGRVYIYAEGPIVLGRIAGLVVLVTTFFLVAGRNRVGVLRLLNLVVMGQSIFLLVSTGSRGPLVSLIIALFYWFFSLLTRRGLKTRVCYAVGIITVILVPLLLWLMRNSFPSQYFSYSAFSRTHPDIRMNLIRTSLGLYAESPIIGLGTGTLASTSIVYPHNLLVEVLVENGPIGLICLLTMVVPVGCRTLREIRMRPDSDMSLCSMLFLYVLLNSMISGHIGDNSLLWMFGSICGLPLTETYKHKEILH